MGVRYTRDYISDYMCQHGCRLITPVYERNSQKLEFECKCGKIGRKSFAKFKLKPMCKDCGHDEGHREFRTDIEKVRKELADMGCTLTSTTFKSAHDNIEFICHCGRPGTAALANLRKSRRCYQCAREAIYDALRHDYEYVFNFFKEQGCELLEDSYVDEDTPMRYRCNCGNIARIAFHNFRAGQRCYQCRSKRISEALKDPNITDEERAVKRQTLEYKYWRRSVYERDNFTCQCCGQRGGKLHAHHMDNYKDFKDRRLDVDNGITFCKECHTEFHNTYGRRHTTRWQTALFLGQKFREQKQMLEEKERSEVS